MTNKQKMTGPWYTVEETLNKLGLVFSELEYAIKKKQIYGAVRLKRQPLLLFTIDKRGWVGHATALYDGHLIPYSGYISSLLDGKKITFDRAYGTVAEPEYLYQWDSRYPFIEPPPLEPLSHWEPHPIESRPIDNYNAAFRPRERKSTMTVVQKILAYGDHHAKTDLAKTFIEDQEMLSGKNWDATKLFFDQSKIAPTQLRVPASEIARFLNHATSPNTLVHAEETSKIAFDVSSVPMRENMLHSLIGRILEDQPDISAKAAWRLIQSDCDAEDPKFDHDRILDEVSSDVIYWRSRDEIEQSMTWKSFQTKLSDLKKRQRK